MNEEVFLLDHRFRVMVAHTYNIFCLFVYFWQFFFHFIYSRHVKLAATCVACGPIDCPIQPATSVLKHKVAQKWQILRHILMWKVSWTENRMRIFLNCGPHKGLRWTCLIYSNGSETFFARDTLNTKKTRHTFIFKILKISSYCKQNLHLVPLIFGDTVLDPNPPPPLKKFTCNLNDP